MKRIQVPSLQARHAYTMYVGPLRMSEENVKKVHDRPAT